MQETLHVFRERPDFVCLPEYYLLEASVTDHHRAALEYRRHLEYLQLLSDQLSTCLIGGTVVEAVDSKLYNTSYVINRGEIVGKYRKRHPVPNEVKAGMTAGADPFVAEIDGVRIGVLICADVFHPEVFKEHSLLRSDIIFIPTTSVYRPDDTLTEKHRRDKQFFETGASTALSFVVKVCGVGSIFGKPLQGRSLVAAPWGMVTRTQTFNEQDKRVIAQTLDIAELRDFRAKLSKQRSGTV
jgi:predicted amidohydrolase